MAQRICLNMIVKNEAHVIRRCLESVRPLITDWLIVDTGSTDGTQALIQDLMSDLPGGLVERPWVNFAHNRTEALNLAPADVDYLLFIDADEEMVVSPGFELPQLTDDAYMLPVQFGGTHYLRLQLARRSLPWRWEGVLHEHLTGADPYTRGELQGVYTVPRPEGARSLDPDKYKKDALVLEEALKQDPRNSRYVFYLAQSYRDAQQPEQALSTYERRASMGGWPEEVWYSQYQMARLRDTLGRPWPEVMATYLEAYQTQPARAETLYRIGMHYQHLKAFATAHLFLSQAATLPALPDFLFAEHEIYQFHARLEAAVAEYYLGRHADALTRYDDLLRDPNLPPRIQTLIRQNQAFSHKALGLVLT
ncbi:glycosyltransferase [Deinococcus sp. HMF7604]|uniref:tetratricopeptide repeat-containing glycosyltransferase n=1 Tax=Deinococcus betulae TaxID=2873312 RepID=UPI001CCB17CE|nr:glycosyltransferase [Deinococcus betulae]MBZ9750379.1 glycosyltransferase [Deinococcus betulae]